MTQHKEININSREAAVCLYILSFVLPVFKDLSLFGFHAFLLSVPFVYGEFYIANIAWLANITFFISLLAGKKSSLFLSVCSIVLALTIFFMKNIDIISSGLHMHDTLFIGYYCWLLSFVVLFSRKVSEYLEWEKGNKK